MVKKSYINIIICLLIIIFNVGGVYASEDKLAEKSYEVFLKNKNKNDFLALQSLQKSAQFGYEKAEFDLGVAYGLGEYGLVQDYQKSREWLEKSAEKNNAKAQLALGIYYLNGDGVQKNTEKSVFWLLKSADQGDASAQYNLGSMYLSGEGGNIDY